MTSDSLTTNGTADRATAEVAFCSLLAIVYAGLYSQTIDFRVTVILLIIFSVICGLILRCNATASFSRILARCSMVALALLVAAFVFMIMSSGSAWKEAITDTYVLLFLVGNALAALCFVVMSCLARPVLAELFVETWRVRNEITKALKYIILFGGPGASIAATDLPAKVLELLKNT